MDDSKEKNRMFTKKLLTSLASGALALTTAMTPVLATLNVPYTDVSQDRVWYTDGITYCYAEQILTGTSPTTFSPNKNMDRAMLVTALYRMDGKPDISILSSFTDVPADSYYAKAVAWAAANNIVTGYNQTTFKPADPVTREQFATILARYHVYKGYQLEDLADLSSYPDANAIAPYAVEGMKWAVGNKIITGNEVDKVFYLNPRGESSRAQIATIIYRYRMDRDWDIPSQPDDSQNPDDSQKPDESPDQNPDNPSPEQPGDITVRVQNWLNKGASFFLNGEVDTQAPNLETMITSLEFKNGEVTWENRSGKGSSKYSLSGFNVEDDPASGFPDSSFQGKIVIDSITLGGETFNNAEATMFLHLTSSPVQFDAWTGLTILFDDPSIEELVAYNGNFTLGISLNADDTSLFIDDTADYSSASEATQEVFSILTKLDTQARALNPENYNWTEDNGNIVKDLTFTKAAVKMGFSDEEEYYVRAGGFYRLGDFTKSGNTYSGTMIIDDLYRNGKMIDIGQCNVSMSLEDFNDHGKELTKIRMTIIPTDPSMADLVIMKDMVGYLD